MNKHRIRIIRSNRNLLEDNYCIEEQKKFLFFSYWKLSYTTQGSVQYPCYYNNVTDVILNFLNIYK